MRKLIYTNERGGSIEFSSDQQLYITSIDGLSQNQISLSESNVANQIGSSVTGNKIEAKDISISGIFKYDPEKRKRILAVILPGVKATLRYMDDIEDLDVYIEGYPSETPTIDWDRLWDNFDFTFHAPFPYWKQSGGSYLDFVSYEALFKFPYTFSSTEQWKISEKIVNQLNTIVNEGSVSIGFIVHFKAKDTVVGPELLKVTTQEVIKLSSLTMEVGDELIVSTMTNDCYCRLVREGEEQNVFYNMDFESTFFQLDIGENYIRFDADSGVENLEVSIDYAITYAGV